jgi:hypothetical protein
MKSDGAVMVQVIPFPLRSRVHLVRSLADDLDVVHGAAANELWRSRIASLVAEMRKAGHSDGAIRDEIYELQSAVQADLQGRAKPSADAGSLA